MTQMVHKFSRRLRSDERGAYLIELALLLPMFLMLIMGIFDIGIAMYAKSVLAGAVEQAARENTLETSAGSQTAIDALVTQRVGTVAGYGTLSFARQNYDNFSDVGSPENFTDSNGNGVRNPGECYQDVNGNGTWDADRGAAGQGGASDVVIYTVTLNYNRLFPLWRMLGEPQAADIKVTTVLRNQPYTNQTTTSVVRCT